MNARGEGEGEREREKGKRCLGGGGRRFKVCVACRKTQLKRACGLIELKFKIMTVKARTGGLKSCAQKKKKQVLFFLEISTCLFFSFLLVMVMVLFVVYTER